MCARNSPQFCFSVLTTSLHVVIAVLLYVLLSAAQIHIVLLAKDSPNLVTDHFLQVFRGLQAKHNRITQSGPC